MGRSSPRTDSDDDNAAAAATTTSGNNDQQQHPHSIRDRFRFKRSPNHTQDKTQTKPSLHRYLLRHRHVNSTPSAANAATSGPRFNRKGFSSLFPFRGAYLLYFMIFLAVFAFAMASMVLQNSIASVFGAERGRPIREELRFGSRLKFVPDQVGFGNGLDGLRSTPRFGVRPPRIGLVSAFFSKLNLIRFFD